MFLTDNYLDSLLNQYDKIRYSFIRQKEPIQTVTNNIQLLRNVTIQLHVCRKNIVIVFYCCVFLVRRSHKTARNRCCVPTLIMYLKLNQEEEKMYKYIYIFII